LSQSREVDPKALRRSSLSYWGDESGDDNSGSSSSSSQSGGIGEREKLLGGLHLGYDNEKLANPFSGFILPQRGTRAIDHENAQGG